MSCAITLQGQTRINQIISSENALVIEKMVVAYLPGQNPDDEIDRSLQLPDSSHIMYEYFIPAENKGYVNKDQVVYSMLLGSNIGNFSFNWIGLIEKDTGIVIAVQTTHPTVKRKTDNANNITGNNITRNMMLQFRDAKQVGNITIPAATWQFDFTEKFRDVDFRSKESKKYFFGDMAFEKEAGDVEKLTVSKFKVKPGEAFAQGIFADIKETEINNPSLPTSVFLEVWQEQEGNILKDKHQTLTKTTVPVDFLDHENNKHYFCKLAEIAADGTIKDCRENICESISQGIEGWIKSHNSNKQAHPELRKWDNLLEKPAVFPPDSHGHSWVEISGKPSTFPATSHTHDWDRINHKPSTFPPNNHGHSWGQISGKPSTFPANSHTHDWDRINHKPSTFPPNNHGHSWGQISGKPSTFPTAPHSHFVKLIGTRTSIGNWTIIGLAANKPLFLCYGNKYDHDSSCKFHVKSGSVGISCQGGRHFTFRTDNETDNATVPGTVIIPVGKQLVISIVQLTTGTLYAFQ